MNEAEAIELARKHVAEKGLEWKAVVSRRTSREWYFFGRKVFAFVVQTERGRVFICVSEAESRVTHFGDPVA